MARRLYSGDTSPEAERVLVDLHRSLPGWRKLEWVEEEILDRLLGDRAF